MPCGAPCPRRRGQGARDDQLHGCGKAAHSALRGPASAVALPGGAAGPVGASRVAGPAGDLLDSAAGGPCGPAGPGAGRVLAHARQVVRRLLEDSARDWLGHCVAVFISGPAGLAKAIPLPAGLGEQALFGPRPHVRPLLVAIQRQPAYRVAVVNRRHAWLFAVAGDQIDMVTQPAAPGVSSPHYGGWYGLESRRVNERIAELARHHFRDTAAILTQSLHSGHEQLVVGGHADTIPQFLATLPAHVRDRFAGSFIADTSTLTPARVRALADPIIRTWVEKSGQQLVTRIQQEPPGGLAATGLTACLNAVRQHAVQILAVPDHGLVPGFACRRCGALGRTRTGCAHGASAASAVPDLIEEIAVGTIHDGGQVQAVPDPPGGIAARLRFPVSHSDNTPVSHSDNTQPSWPARRPPHDDGSALTGP